MTIDEFKSHFYQGQDFIHLNASGQALIPDVNRDLHKHWLDRFYREGASCAMEGWAQTDVVREKLAKLIGAHTEEVSFFVTTASALSQAALGIPFQAGDEILTWDQEYPSNFYPWRVAAERSQAKLIQVESENWQTPAEKILSRVNSKTKAVAVSWVQYQTGAVTDLKKISEQLKGTGVWLIADLIQGVGARPFNFHESGFDIVCGGSHKFLCSNYGASYMAVRKERAPQLQPIEFGAMTYGDPDTTKSFTIPTKTNGYRYEPGSKPMMEVIALGATLDLFTAIGVSNIYREGSRLAARLAQGLKEMGFPVLSPEGLIVNFAPHSATQLTTIVQALNTNKVSHARRGPGIRFSTHGYNRDEEMDRVLEIVRSCR